MSSTQPDNGADNEGPRQVCGCKCTKRPWWLAILQATGALVSIVEHGWGFLKRILAS